MDPLEFLSRITVILFIGLVVGLISKKLKLPSMLLLIMSGVVLNNIYVNGVKIFALSDDFLVSASILALAIIVFQGSSKFRIKDLDTYSESALKLALVFLVMNLFFLSIATGLLFRIKNILLCLVFAAVMSGTDPGSIISLFPTKSNKVIDILKFESIINTPFVVLIPFILLDIMELESGISSSFIEYFLPFLQQIITGIGTGVVIGLIVFRFMRKFYSEKLSALTLLTSALMTYILAEKLGGNGVLAVTVLGIFFGNAAVKKKQELQEFSVMLSNILEMLVFILIGFLLPLDFTLDFILKSILLFLLMLAIRYIAIHLVYMHDHVNIRERIFMTLNCTTGIAVAVVAFILSNYVLDIPMVLNGTEIINSIPLQNLPGTGILLDLIVLFIFYGAIVSSVVSYFSNYFIKVKVEDD